MNRKEDGDINFSDLSDSEKSEIVQLVQHLFISRADVYAEQRVQEGKQSYKSVKQPLTEEVLSKHFKGEGTIGTYQIEPKTGRVKWGVLDIDGEYVADAKAKTEKLRKRLVNAGVGCNNILMEESGSPDSYHLWIFFEKPTEARKVKEFLERIAKPVDPGIEIFPKQDKISTDGFGNLVKLPFGFHKVAEKWSDCYIQTEEGERIVGFDTLKHIEPGKLPEQPKLKTTGLRPCFECAIDEMWTLEGAEGHEFRLALLCEMMMNNYPEEDIHRVYKLQSDYSAKKTQENIDYAREKGYKTWKCETIRDKCSTFLAGMCTTCARTSKSKKEKEERKKEKATLEDVLNMPDYNREDEIANYVVLKKEVNQQPQQFYVEIRLVAGEIKSDLTYNRAIPISTAPSLDFYKKEYESLKELYTELYTIIADYAAFSEASIYPQLIALGSMASYFREVYYTFPYYDYISSEPESGKTTAMKVQTFLSFYGTIAASITEALLFREIDGSHCFYGLDNIERLFASPKDFASIIDWLLSSYSRDIPCKRLEKTEEGYQVRYFDGYCIKAFTHIRDFPFALRALRSRCIQIVMESGKPKKFYPTAAKFTETRDKLYKARLYESEAVKKSYEDLIDSNVLTGRTGDLYYPLLSIAKLVGETLYKCVLKYATADEIERKELDSWNSTLITVLIENDLIGSQNTKDIREFLEDALKGRGLLKETDKISTQRVTVRLKKLGFKREEKKTGNKTWFLISEQKLMSKAHEYDLSNAEELEKVEDGLTPPKPNYSNLSNFDEIERTSKEGSTERGEEVKLSTGEFYSNAHSDGGALVKLEKLAKKGVCLNKKQKTEIKQISPVEEGTCERCGKEHYLDHEWSHEGRKCLICPECAEDLKSEDPGLPIAEVEL